MRPTLEDVARLSRGLSAHSKVGSRSVPHRLNNDEHNILNIAIQKGYAVLQQTQHRKHRKGSPLLNTLRMRADALARPLVWVELGPDQTATDAACVDLSPLRLRHKADVSQLLALAHGVARDHGATPAAEAGVDEAAAPLADADALESAPIWSLPPLYARFLTCRAEVGPKDVKQLAASLSRALTLRGVVAASS